MTNEIKKSGRTVEEAIQLALIDLDTTKENVEVIVLEEGSKGFFGIFGSKDATVLVKKKETANPCVIAENFLREMFASMNLAVQIKAEMREKQLYIDLDGDEMGMLIGKRGQTLDSIQYLVNLVVNKNSDSYISVMIDTENYRERRKETLESLAHNLAKKVKQSRKNIVLEPMNPYERRIIHSALQNDKYVTTFSEGKEPFRYVVLTLKKKDGAPAGNQMKERKSPKMKKTVTEE